MTDLASIAITWPQAVVATVVILAATVWPGWLGYLQSKRAHAELKPNHGTSMRDAVDRIEKKVDDIGERVTALEETVTRP